MNQFSCAILTLVVLFAPTASAQPTTGKRLHLQAQNLRQQVEISGNMVAAEAAAKEMFGQKLADQTWFIKLRLQRRAGIMLWGMDVQNYGENKQRLSHMGAPQKELDDLVQQWETCLKKAGYYGLQKELEKLEEEYFQLRHQ